MTKRKNIIAMAAAIGIIAGGCSSSPDAEVSLAGQDVSAPRPNLDDAFAASGDASGTGGSDAAAGDDASWPDTGVPATDTTSSDVDDADAAAWLDADTSADGDIGPGWDVPADAVDGAAPDADPPDADLADADLADTPGADVADPDGVIPGDADPADTPEPDVADLCADDAECDDDDACTVDTCDPSGLCAWVPVECAASGEQCQVAVCEPASGCVVVPADDGLACDDEEPCTNDDVCFGGSCVGAPNPCDDGDACTEDGCNPGEGWVWEPVECTAPGAACVAASCDPDVGCTAVFSPDGTPCDDGEPCTVKDACLLGACAGDEDLCDDEDACTDDGCAPGAGCWHQGVDCAEPDETCLVAACNSVTGCGTEAVSDGLACDDGALCTADDVCTGGVCQGASADCDDDDACTNDGCSSDGGCTPTPVICPEPLEPCTVATCDSAAGCGAGPAEDGTGCDDGDICTVDDTCEAGQCVGAEADCDDDDACTVDTCDKAAGCQHLPVVCDASEDVCFVATCEADTGCVPAPAQEGTPCNDSEPCTVNDSCQGDGTCSGAPDPCHDDNACTTDACTPGFGCLHETVSCPDPDVPCLVAACDLLTGCAATAGADGAPCDDGVSCTTEGACQGGGCLGGPPACDDGDGCTEDTCDPVTGDCSYGDVECPASDEPCLVAVCQAPAGCALVAGGEGGGCDDANPCTSDDVCQGGICVGGGNPCDDGDLCTVDICLDDGGCEHEAVDCPADPDQPCKKASCSADEGCLLLKIKFGTPCEDGLVCTVDTYCQGGICQKGGPNLCDDGDPCTSDSCAEALGGCQHADVSCPTPSDPCLVAVCDGVGGCAEVPGNDGASCNDGDVCTIGDACAAGVCGGTPDDCDDGNACTDDACVPGAGCHATTVICAEPVEACHESFCDETDGCLTVGSLDGTSCDDGEVCTLDDECLDGACVGGLDDCDDGNACTTDACVLGEGCELETVVCPEPDEQCLTAVCDTNDGCGVEALDDGNSCNASDGCSSASCESGACVEAPTPGCGVHAQCNDAPAGASCNDEDPTSVSDACFAGLCAGWQHFQVEAPTEIELTLVDHAGGSWWVGGFLEDTGHFLAIADVPSSPGLVSGTVQEAAFSDLESGFAVDLDGQVWRLNNEDWSLSQAYNNALEESGTGELLGLWRGQKNGATQLWLVGEDGDQEYIRYCGPGISGGAAGNIACWPQLLNDSNPPSLPRAVAGALECGDEGCHTGRLVIPADAESQGGSFWNDMFENHGGEETNWLLGYYDDGASAMQSRGAAALTTSRFLIVGLDGYMRHRDSDGGWSYSLDWLKNGAAGTRDFRAVWVGQGAIFVAASNFAGGEAVGLEIWTCPAGASPEVSDHWTIHSLDSVAPDGGLYDISGTNTEMYAVGLDGEGGSQIWVRLP